MTVVQVLLSLCNGHAALHLSWTLNWYLTAGKQQGMAGYTLKKKKEKGISVSAFSPMQKKNLSNSHN